MIDAKKLKERKYLKIIGKNKWEVIKPIEYLFRGNIYLIPTGFVTDVCSCSPNCDWWYACVVHDWLYTLGDYIVDKKTRTSWRRHADKTLAQLMRQVSTCWFKRTLSAIYYLGVRIFGAKVFWKPNYSSEHLVKKFAYVYDDYLKISIWGRT